MGLIEDIEEIEKSKMPKWKKIKEYEAEVRMMIEKGIPIKKQIELILKNQIVDKLYYKEYRDILVKHFGYTGRQRKQLVFNETDKKPSDKRTKKTATDILSGDVDLFAAKVAKDAAAIK